MYVRVSVAVIFLTVKLGKSNLEKHLADCDDAYTSLNKQEIISRSETRRSPLRRPNLAATLPMN